VIFFIYIKFFLVFLRDFVVYVRRCVVRRHMWCCLISRLVCDVLLVPIE